MKFNIKKAKKITIYFFIFLIALLLIYEFSSFFKSERFDKLLETWAIGQEHLERERIGGY